MYKKKVLIVFGTRPEAIKMCPLVVELKRRDKFEVVVAVTGQHREMLDQVLEVFGVSPKYDLQIMKENQSLLEILEAVMRGMLTVLKTETPDITLVHGDTLTAYATALTCFMERFEIGHVEAGLRTYNMAEPFPEEFNRRSVALMAKYHFAPTQRAKDNLLRENRKEHVYVTGNTAIDALKFTVKDNFVCSYLEEAKGRKLILLTLHRRENWNEPMRNVFRALREIADEYKDEVYILYPMHKNPTVRMIAKEILGECENAKLTEPLDAIEFHNIMARCSFVVTDSGGIQEEAPYFGKPVLVARNVTERPEGVEAGTIKLIGTDETEVYQNIKMILEKRDIYDKMSHAANPYGDGTASTKIADILEKELDF